MTPTPADSRTCLLDAALPAFRCKGYSATTVGDICGAGISVHADTLLPMIEAARSMYAPKARWTARSLALFTQAALQGAFVVAKKSQGTAQAAQPLLAHLRAYVQGLFGDAPPAPTPRKARSK